MILIIIKLINKLKNVIILKNFRIKMKKSLILLFCMNMFSGIGYSIVAPLFPILENDFSISEALLGWIISTFAISNCIITPFIPRLCKRFSRISLLYFATFFEATCTLLYSFLEKIPSLPLFLIIVFSLRIIHGICSGFIGTLVYSISCSLASEEEIKSVLGYIEIGLSLGSSSGPLFVSIFYKIGGYKLPFIILGLFLYISVYLTKILEREKLDNDEIDEDPAFFKYLNNRDIILLSGAIILGMIAFTFFFPSLTNHLTQKYNLDVSLSSLCFSVPVVSYFIMINLTNIISKKIGNFNSMSAGIFANTIAIYLIYPLPPFPNNLVFIIIGLSLIGAGGPLIFILSLLELSKSLKNICGYYDQSTINDIASAINNLFISVGDLLGPIIGGFFSSHFSFQVSCTVIFAIFFIYFILFISLYNKDSKIEVDNSLSNNKSLQEELFK